MISILYKKFINLDYKYHIAFALLIRVIFIAYGSYHDELSAVPYTDVDYKVFTDASRHILAKNSPYDRHTYRYTPLIAILLIPNVIFCACFGKFVFSMVDLLVGLLIRQIVRNNLTQFHCYKDDAINGNETQISNRRRRSGKKSLNNKEQNHFGDLDATANISMILWLYNPMTIAIATRGNCDSIAALLVLCTLYFLQCKRSCFLAGLFHGVSIHVRLYPIAYSLAMFMYLSKFSFYSEIWEKNETKAIKETQKHNDVMRKSDGSVVAARSVQAEHKTIFKREYLMYFVPNLDQLKLIFGCISSFCLLTTLFYAMYGYKFLYETYIYHFLRKDTRHNFSIYFYLQYLTAGVYIGVWQRVLILLPQVVLLLMFSVRYGLNKFSLNFSILVQTVAMVTYNTVLTSQYFIWIVAVLPLCIWQIKMTPKSAVFLMCIWFAAQLAWLLPAYFLEFHGKNTFLFIWIQSVSFFCANIAILGRLIMNFMPAHKHTE